MKLNIEVNKILEVLGIIFVLMIINFVLYTALGDLYVTLLSICMVVFPLYFAYKLIRKLAFKLTKYQED